MARTSWPEHVVAEDRVHEILGHKSGDRAALAPHDHERLSRFKDLIQRATLSGRVRRLVLKDPESGEVLGRGYYRNDLRKIIGLRSRPQLLVPKRERFG